MVLSSPRYGVMRRRARQPEVAPRPQYHRVGRQRPPSSASRAPVTGAFYNHGVNGPSGAGAPAPEGPHKPRLNVRPATAALIAGGKGHPRPGYEAMWLLGHQRPRNGGDYPNVGVQRRTTRKIGVNYSVCLPVSADSMVGLFASRSRISESSSSSVGGVSSATAGTPASFFWNARFFKKLIGISRAK